MSRSLDVQSNARGIMIVKNMHKCHKHHAILHKLCTWFGKNKLRLYLKEQKFLRLGRPPSKYAHGHVTTFSGAKMLDSVSCRVVTWPTKWNLGSFGPPAKNSQLWNQL